MLKFKKVTAFFLSCLMLFGTLAPIGEVLAQDFENEIVITLKKI